MEATMDIDRINHQHREKGGGSEKGIQPPLTPMIDVTFQLLLYFLLTADFREQEGQIPGTLPGGTNVCEAPKIEIAIMPVGEMFQSCQYEVDNRPPVTTPRVLRETLEEMKKTFDTSRTVIHLKCAGAVRWKYVVEAYNAAVFNNFAQISFQPVD